LRSSTLPRKTTSSCVKLRMDSVSSYINLMKKHSRKLLPLSAGVTSGGMLKGKVDAVLFDIYGTLFVSSSGDIEEAREKVKKKRLEELLRRYGVSLKPGEVQRRYFGEIEKVHERLKEEGVDVPEVEIDSVWMRVLEFDDPHRSRMFSCEYEMLFNPVWPMPYLETLLRRVRDSGRVMGMVSNAQFFTPLLFELFLGASIPALGFHPSITILSFQHGRAKPSLVLFEMARRALEEMGVGGESVLYVGNDMLNDIYPAHLAGFQTALFAGDRRSLRLREDDERCRRLSPELVVTNLEELTEHIISCR
jgi:putative hydrolase of the HAD superfamily